MKTKFTANCRCISPLHGQRPLRLPVFDLGVMRKTSGKRPMSGGRCHCTFTLLRGLPCFPPPSCLLSSHFSSPYDRSNSLIIRNVQTHRICLRIISLDISVYMRSLQFLKNCEGSSNSSPIAFIEVAHVSHFPAV